MDALHFKTYTNIIDRINSRLLDDMCRTLFQRAFRQNIGVCSHSELKLYVRLLLTYLALSHADQRMDDASLINEEDKKLVVDKYQIDPSDFDNMFLYGIVCMVNNDRIRAQQLFDRLERTGWAGKPLAKSIIDQIYSAHNS